MSYADGRSLSTAYDNRLRPTSWNVANVLGYNYTYQGDYLDERTGRVTYAQSLYDATLDRSYEYDNAGRLAISHSGAEARAHVGLGQWGTLDGPYSQGYDYDVWGNVTHKYGWGGEVQGGTAGQSSDIYYSYTNNRRNGFAYDAAGNLSNDGQQSFSYDATGQQSYAAGQIGGSSPPSFSDDPLVAGQTIIKAAHLTELRTAVNQARARAGLAAATWAEAVTSGVLIKAAHIVELRARLDEARSALGLSAAAYTDAGLSVGYTVKAAHVQELRERVKEALGPVPITLYQYYDGDGLRVKKTENGATTYYLRSSVLGGQVVAELNGSGGWTRGYVYAGSSLLAVQQGGVYWMHEDPVTKSKRVTNSAGAIVSTIELDPWGADTNRSSNSAFQPKKFTSYDRDMNGTDEAMFRRYNRKHSRFDQPDPYDGSYDLTNPQSFNRYAYVQGDPVNFVDPSGLRQVLAVPCPAGYQCITTNTWAPSWDGFTAFLLYIFFGQGGGIGGPSDPGGGGGFGHEAGHTVRQDNRTTCEKFADRVQELANAANSIGELLDRMATTFMSDTHGHPTNASPLELHASVGGAFSGEARMFSSNGGIREKYAGAEGGGQIRHFVGALIAASWPLGTSIMMAREMDGPSRLMDKESVADRALNGLASYVYDTVFFTNFGMEGNRTPSDLGQVRQSLAGEIRRDLCDQ